MDTLRTIDLALEPLAPAHAPMMRRMLTGIKERAERAAKGGGTHVP